MKIVLLCLKLNTKINKITLLLPSFEIVKFKTYVNTAMLLLVNLKHNLNVYYL